VAVEFDAILARLSAERPVFHSEADFQHALAWAIREMHSNVAVRLEVPRQVNGRRARIDLWLQDGTDRAGVEVKYFTRKVATTIAAEPFQLADRAAQDLGRYDVLSDLLRVETLVDSGGAERGAVIVLTNDAAYWTPPGPLVSVNYEAFRLFDGRELLGRLAWGPATGVGTMRGREAPIELRRAYRLAWNEYSDLGPEVRHGRFRYLKFDVSPLNAATGPAVRVGPAPL
jgi:hypothetical protein